MTAGQPARNDGWVADRLPLAELPGGAGAYRGRRVCVTGGAGFIGSHLVDGLVAAGAEVAVIDDLSSGRRDNLAAAGGAVRLVEGSILDPARLAEACAGAATVFHLAAIGSVPQSIAQPVETIEVNVRGTLAVLEAAHAAGASRVVYSASSSAYGDRPESPKHESLPLDPRSPYAASKLAGEHLMRSQAICRGISTLSLRYFNIFGPRQRADSPYAAVIPKFAEAIEAGAAPTIFGTGEQTRDFTFVSNAVWANLLAGAAPAPLAGEAVNVGCGRGVSLLELLSAIAALRGTSVAPRHEPARLGDVMHSTASIALAQAMLGYRVVVGFEPGLRLTLPAA